MKERRFGGELTRKLQCQLGLTSTPGWSKLRVHLHRARFLKVDGYFGLQDYFKHLTFQIPQRLDTDAKIIKKYMIPLRLHSYLKATSAWREDALSYMQRLHRLELADGSMNSSRKKKLKTGVCCHHLQQQHGLCNQDKHASHRIFMGCSVQTRLRWSIPSLAFSMLLLRDALVTYIKSLSLRPHQKRKYRYPAPAKLTATSAMLLLCGKHQHQPGIKECIAYLSQVPQDGICHTSILWFLANAT